MEQARSKALEDNDGFVQYQAGHAFQYEDGHAVSLSKLSSKLRHSVCVCVCVCKCRCVCVCAHVGALTKLYVCVMYAHGL